MTGPVTTPDGHPGGTAVRMTDIPAQLGWEAADCVSLGARPPPGSAMFHPLVELDEEAANG